MFYQHAEGWVRSVRQDGGFRLGDNFLRICDPYLPTARLMFSFLCKCPRQCMCALVHACLAARVRARMHVTFLAGSHSIVIAGSH